MIDVSLAMQDAIIAALRADPAIAAKVAARIYDRVPNNAARPYIAFGPSQVNEERIDCIDGAEVFQQVNVVSEDPGFAECKTISNLVRTAIHKFQASQGSLRFEIEHRFTNIFRSPDGVTNIGAISFRATIDQ